MNKQFLPAFWVCVIFATQLTAQLQLAVKSIDQNQTWGVFVKPVDGLSPSARTVTGFAKVTLITPLEGWITDLVANSGGWTLGSAVRGPKEAPYQSYYTIHFTQDQPQIFYHDRHETLLFTFRMDGGHDKSPRLADNENDPYVGKMNSLGTLALTELNAIDFGVSPVQYLSYTGIYKVLEKEKPASVSVQVNTTPLASLGNSEIAKTSNSVLSGNANNK